MANLAILPARKGSKRIPNKNLAEVAGAPLITYPIGAAINSNLFDKVMVSTDSEEIAAVGRSAGAEVPFFRSEKNSDDFAITLDVLKEVLQEYKKQGETFEYICCIYPTAIFTRPEDLAKSFQVMKEKNYEGVVATTNFEFHPYRSFSAKKGGKVKYNWPEYITTRTQDLPHIFHDAGMFYWCRADKIFEKDKVFISEDFGFYHIDNIRCHDIDYPEDLKMAEFKFSYLNSEAN